MGARVVFYKGHVRSSLVISILTRQSELSGDCVWVPLKEQRLWSSMGEEQ
jgi:hypothetical protein